MGRNQVPVAISILMLIDSLEMTEKCREEIVQHCLHCDEDKLIITHGTDTMTETAGVLAKMVPHKTIVLTGAMIGEQLRAKIAFYLSLIQLDIEYNFGRHTRFLMIDSPGKEEGDANYLEGLSGVLKSIQSRFGDKLQILIGTAERGLNGIVENEYITPPNTYVF